MSRAFEIDDPMRENTKAPAASTGTATKMAVAVPVDAAGTAAAATFTRHLCASSLQPGDVDSREVELAVITVQKMWRVHRARMLVDIQRNEKLLRDRELELEQTLQKGHLGARQVPVKGMVMLLEQRMALKRASASLIFAISFFVVWTALCIESAGAHAAYLAEKPLRDFDHRAKLMITDKASWSVIVN